MSVSLKIKIFDSRGTQLLQIAKSTVTIGSAEHCDVVLTDKTVHPEHARAWLEGGRIWVQDLGGNFGTSLNDIRLPALKPMLVRELDVLRLGQAEATLNLEALAMRQPVVKPALATASAGVAATPANEAPSSESLEAGKRRAELEKLGRELAEVRLQLQVAKLDRDSDQERSNQVESLREEVKNVREQQGKWTESLRQMENEKLVLRKKAETEIADIKIKLQTDLKSLREQDQARFAAQKKQMVTDVMLEVRGLSNQKVRGWATRPLSAEMIAEWEGDLNTLLRKQILGEVVPVNTVTAVPAPVSAAPASAHAPAVKAPRAAAAVTDGGETAKIRIRRFTGKSKGPGRLKSAGRALLLGLSVVVVLVGAGRYFKQRNAASLSSQAPSPVTVGAHAPASLVTRAPLKQSNKFRATYTENVLFLNGYLALERDAAFHGRWLGEFMKTAGDEWNLGPGAIAPLLGLEQNLLQDLAKLSAGVNVENQAEVMQKMQAREALFDRDLLAALKNQAGVDRFMKLKKTFYQRNQKM